jgi:hypothetical protein
VKSPLRVGWELSEYEPLGHIYTLLGVARSFSHLTIETLTSPNILSIYHGESPRTKPSFSEGTYVSHDWTKRAAAASPPHCWVPLPVSTTIYTHQKFQYIAITCAISHFHHSTQLEKAGTEAQSSIQDAENEQGCVITAAEF